MALDGFQIGAAEPGSGALKGFSIGASAAVKAPAAAPVAAAPISNGNALKGFTADPFAIMKDPQGAILPMPKMSTPGSAFNDFLHYNDLLHTAPDLSGNSLDIKETPEATKNPIVAKVTGGSTLKQFGKDLLGGLPSASKNVSDTINAPIKKAGDLLSNTKFIQEATAGIDEGDVSGNTAESMLQKLSLGLQGVEGATGGLYQAPDMDPNKNDFLDKGLSILAKAVGFGAGITAIGSVATTGYMAGSNSAIQGLGNLAARFPLVGKYIAPYIEPLASMAVGAAVESQLDPKLAGDFKKRSSALGAAIATAPLYTALGSIKSAKISLPASFALGFGMAKLSGADNDEAISSGLAFTLLDAFGRAGESRGFTATEITEKLNTEARSTLSKYSGVKITKGMTAAELKSAYYVAAHRTHPDVGGTKEAFQAVESAYSLLSKGAAVPEAAESIKLLSGAVKDTVKTHGDEIAHQAIKDNLGVDDTRATILLNAAKTPQTPAQLAAVHERALERVRAQETSDAKANIGKAMEEGKQPDQKDVAVSYYNENIGPIVKSGETVVVDPDMVKRAFNDYSDANRNIYSKATQDVLLRALKENPSKNFTLVGGGPGSGKSEFFTKGLSADKHPGVTYDSTQSSPEFVSKLVAKAKEMGKEPQAFFTISDPASARLWSLIRHAETGREVGQDFFIKAHSGYPKTILRLIEEGVPVHAIDTRGKTGEQIAKEIEKGEYADNLVDVVKKMEYDEDKIRTAVQETEKQYAHSKQAEETKSVDAQTAGEGGEGALREGGRGEEELTPEQIEEKANQFWTENFADEFERLGDELTRLEQQRRNMKAGPDRDALEERAVQLGAEMGQMENAHIEKFYSGQRGFVNPGRIAEDVAAATRAVARTMREIENARQLTGDVRTSIYQHENARKALRIRLTKLVEQVGDMLDAQGWENLYHYDENKDEALDPQSKQIYDTVIVPLKRTLTDVITDYKEAGGILTPDLFFMNEGEYTPRFAKDKQSALDKLLEKGKKTFKSLQNGGLLSQSLGTVGKSRKFYALTDENGKRAVAYIPTAKSENVLMFQGKNIEDIGPVKGMRTPKVNEYFDDAVMRKLNDLAAALGVTHERVATGQSKGLGHGTAGVSMRGEALIKTRLSPSSVLAHELGHQIDRKYGMQDFMNETRFDAEHKRQIQNEMKALADKRFEGAAVNKTFKSYVRSGNEKMAVMFEAYVLNRQMFKEVAPHLYDDFRDFLFSHEELRPFMDIQPTLTLGMEKHGGEQSGKIGKVFVDKDKNTFTIGQATTKEIETNTNVEYHKNVLANYVVALDRASSALSAVKLLERLKNEEAFGTIIRKDSPEEAPPEGWRAVGDNLPQFRGYHMEPRTAEALEDLASRQRGQMYIPVFDEINNFLTTAIVLNPIMHVPNVISGRAVAAAAGDISPKSLENFKQAWDEVRNKGPLYIEYLEHGAPFMALKETTKNFADAIFNQYTQEVEEDPTRWQEIADILGYVNPAAMMRSFMHVNEKVTWGSNDIFFMHALLDYRDSRGGTMEDAIKEVSKRMADYRIPERILLPGAGGRVLSQLMQSRIMLFGRFHYTGVIKPWLEIARDSATGTGQERRNALQALAYMLIMGFAVWPYINKMWQGITGSPTSYESMPGPLKPIEIAERLKDEGVPGIPRALQSVFTPSPAIRGTIELGFNVDLFNHNPIYGPLPAEGLTTYGSSIISPVASASRMNPADFALSLFGIWTPKNVDAKNDLNRLRYDELPALQSQVKRDIVAGQVAKANDEMAEFNTRAIALWNRYQLEVDGTDFIKTEAQKQEFLKVWGIKTPGQVAIANAAAFYGDGSLTNKSSLIATVSTYAKAIGVSPGEAFHLIFSGQQIARVTNFGLFNPDSAIIVQRAPLAFTEPIKKAQEAAQGLTDQNDALELDHVIPLEAGGTNDEDNLNLIRGDQNKGEQHTFENTLGAAVKAGTISQAKVREYSIRYKVGQGETLPPGYMKEFSSKYKGKIISLAEVVEAINKGDAK